MEDKEYKFFASSLNTVRGYVTAANEEEAKKKILNGDYDDIVDSYDNEIKEILSLEEI